MSIDILYVSHNRRRYSVESFEALISNTDWDGVAALHVYDDGSSDRTYAYLREAILRVPVRVVLDGEPFGGPVAAMNKYLDARSDDADRFAKIDNDMVVCPGWLPEMQRQMTLHPELDILGMEPRTGPAVAPHDAERTIIEAPFIGGKGIIRHRAFEGCRPSPRSRRPGEPAYYGFSEWQRAHREVRKAWISPDLPVFGLDQLCFEPWISLAAGYAEMGWQRPWPPYDSLMDGYWSWWTPVTTS